MDPDVVAALARIPLFEGMSEADMSAQRLGGLTNRNYRIDGEPPAFDLGRMVLHKAMCDLLWTLWGVVQHANGNLAEDFWAYAVGRPDRCTLLMATDEFPRHIEAVQRGPALA